MRLSKSLLLIVAAAAMAALAFADPPAQATMLGAPYDTIGGVGAGIETGQQLRAGGSDLIGIRLDLNRTCTASRCWHRSGGTATPATASTCRRRGTVPPTSSTPTGVPVSRLMEGEMAKLVRMEDVLHERVIGQDEAVSAVASAIALGSFGSLACACANQSSNSSKGSVAILRGGLGLGGAVLQPIWSAD